MITMAILVPIISAILAAIAGILACVLLKDIPAKKILAVNFFIMAATLLVISPFFYKFIFSWQNLGLVVLIASIDTLANYFYFRTFEKTEASIAVPLLSLAPVITFLFSAIFLGELPSLLSVVGALGLILRGYGSGDLPAELFPALEYAQEKKVPVIVTTQCPGGATLLGVDVVGLEAIKRGVIQVFDMSMECMSTKLMWLLGQQVPYERMKERMQFNMMGEVDLRKAFIFLNKELL